MPSGRWQSATMTLRPEPSGPIEWMRPPLSSRTNSRPTAFLRSDRGFDIVLEASVIGLSFGSSGLVCISSASPHRLRSFIRLRGACSCFRNGAAGAQALYLAGLEAELFEDFLAVFAKLGRASGRNLGNVM